MIILQNFINVPLNCNLLNAYFQLKIGLILISENFHILKELTPLCLNILQKV